MSKSQSTIHLPEGSAWNTGVARETFDSVSHAYSEWLQNANRVQTEMIRFIGDRFSKDMNLITRFAGCKQPDEFLRLQAEAVSELASDYMQEGARILALFGEASKTGIGESTRAGGKRAAP